MVDMEQQDLKKYDRMVIRQRKWMLYTLSIMVIGAGFTPYPRIFLGLLIGTALSFYNLWLLQRKIKKLGQAIIEDRRMLGIGSLTRFASAALAVVVGLRFEEYVDIIAIIIGLMTFYIVIIIDFALFNTKD
ncbi:ATP synthase subunit I [Aquibacillus sediminis]|uniref:ATP synthase subunit I n=1 Tax=Aquibacillus sediminis TaxID=2574734 RepID=UPI001FE71DB6|nr:ATP synthase subunit I [Aquibacillus sediminis]